MNTMFASALLLSAWVGQPAEAQPPALAQDQEIQDLLARAGNSAQPQLRLLAERIEGLIEIETSTDPADLKLGIMSVFRHCDSSRDFTMREAYLRLLQYPVSEEIYAAMDTAAAMRIDGSPRDWPRQAIVTHPKPDKKAAKNSSEVVKAFGALRGPESLFVLFQTHGKPELTPAKLIYTIELSLLSNRFSGVDYTVNVAGRKVRIFDSAGAEVVLNEDQPVLMRTGTRALELQIPVSRFGPELRSAAVRGYVVEPKSKKVQRKSPWIACPTGPILEPLEMLIHFAINRELPSANALPVAVALQEGLLLSRSDPSLAERIKKDAYEWLQLALDIDGRLELTSTAQPSTAPFAAQMVWACRFAGHQSMNALEEYEFTVPSPQTIGDMRGYVEVQGWSTAEITAEDLRQQVAKLIVASAEVHDFPNAEAQAAGADYQDSNAKAYYLKGDQRLLSYRDVGVNQRWKLFEEGFGLKGNANQITDFQRMLSAAAGLPTVWAFQLDAAGARHFTLSADARRKKWFPVGAVSPSPTKDKIRLAFGRPWTRPERFDFWELPLWQMPAGESLYLLSGAYEEISNNRMSTILEKGLSHEQLAKKLLPAVRLR